jgi:hypothetical protein
MMALKYKLETDTETETEQETSFWLGLYFYKEINLKFLNL